MKTVSLFALATTALAVHSAIASTEPRPLAGNYLEVRSCDVYTGPCFANAEMGLTGKEGILVWSIREGEWEGTALDGLNVIAVVRTEGTMGDLRYHPQEGKAVLLVDGRATATQQKALKGFARAMAGRLIREVVSTKALPISADLSSCSKSGCANVKAGEVLEVATRCLGNKDHVCGNEEMFYPPLTSVKHAQPAYTEVAAYKGAGLGLTWESTHQRGAYLASFAH